MKKKNIKCHMLQGSRTILTHVSPVLLYFSLLLPFQVNYQVCCIRLYVNWKTVMFQKQTSEALIR